MKKAQIHTLVHISSILLITFPTLYITFPWSQKRLAIL